jgi:hypothetical protein
LEVWTDGALFGVVPAELLTQVLSGIHAMTATLDRAIPGRMGTGPRANCPGHAGPAAPAPWSGGEARTLV